MDRFRAPEPFAFDGPNIAQRWMRWQKQFVTYFTACEISKKTKTVQVSILLHVAGAEAQEVHEQFQFNEDADKDDYTKVLEKFTEYCRPRKNTVYERYRFWSRDQVQDEPVDKWVKDLRTIAIDCEFKEQEDLMIRDKLVFGIRDSRVKERMLRESDVALEKALDICRAAESTKTQMKEMAQGKDVADASINEMKTFDKPGASRGRPTSDTETRSCFKCGRVGHIAPDCTSVVDGGRGRARHRDGNNSCYNCGGIGHYSRECPNGDDFPRGRRGNRGRGRQRGGGAGRGRKKFDEVEENDGLDDYMSEFQSLSLYALHVSMHAASKKPTKRYARFRFHKADSVVEERLKVDTGAEANLMPLRNYRVIYPENLNDDKMPKKRYVNKSEAVLEAYGRTVIEHLGTVTVPCEYNGQKFMCTFFLSDVEGPILLGLPTAEALGIVKITVVDEINVHDLTPKPSERYISQDTALSDRPSIRSKEDLKEMYPECFNPKNKFFRDYEYDIKLDPNVKPSIHAQRRLPVELKRKVKSKLSAMEKDGVLKKVYEPTEWVNSLLVETKPDGNLRICLDPTDLNWAIKREHYPVPVLDDLIPELTESDTFTKLDAKDGYWHVKLNERSSYLTTFNTPFGRYRYLRMPFGLRMSQDVFQRKMDEIYGSCEGAIGIADDITVHGNGEKAHDLHLHEAMERTRQANVCLNYEKISVKKPSVKFFGNMYTADGAKPDPDKVAAIQALRPPENRSELRTFLGMVNYLQQYIPRLSEYTAPLREMDCVGVVFTWNEAYQAVYDRIKKLVAADISLAYYDRTKPVTVQCDYSKKGLGAALVQEGRPIQFASKAVSGAEKNYAPIEGEMLAVLYGVTKFHHFLYGRRFEVESDHKPLQHIQQKNLSRAPPRLRSMLMKLSPYDFSIHYKPGEEMVMPDTFSRLSQVDQDEIPGLKVHVHSIVDISCLRLAKLKRETERDCVLQKLKKVFEEGWPSSIKGLDKDLRPFWAIRDDVSIMDGLLMAGSRIIIPEVSRREVLDNIHEGHQGEVKCNLRAKDAVYWPGIYKSIEEIVKNCGACREFENALPKCPMLGVEVPSQPWHTVGADLFYYKGRWNLLVTDYYSKAPFVRPVANTGAAASIRAMKGIFAENGIPFKVISDNGPHFCAYSYSEFAKRWGFELVLSSPEYPKGHALIERHVQTMKKCMRKCEASGYDFDLALLALRSTPLDSNLPSPAELLSGRRFRTTLPAVFHRGSGSSEVQQKLMQKQKVAAEYYDRTATPKHELVPGQPVRLYNKDSKSWEPATVTERANTPRSYVVERESGGVPLRRNRQHLRSTVETWGAGESTTEPATEPHVEAVEPAAGVTKQITDPVISRPIRCRKQTTFFQAGN